MLGNAVVTNNFLTFDYLKVKIFIVFSFNNIIDNLLIIFLKIIRNLLKNILPEIDN